MDPDPARRPQSIDELRDILGIVAPGSIPPAPPPPLADDPVAQPAASPAPTAASEPVPAAAQAQTMRASASGTQASAPATVAPDASSHPARKRWPLVAGAVIVLAIVLAGLAALRNGDQDKESDSAYNTAPPATATANEPGTQAAADNAPAASPTAAQPPETPVTSTATAAADPGQSAPSRDAVTVPATTPPAVPPAEAPATNATGATNATNNSVSYRLQIQPWGTVYVDGVDRGVSPPVKRLVLAPGRHTIRVANPNFRERVLEIDTASGDGRIAVDFSSAE